MRPTLLGLLWLLVISSVRGARQESDIGHDVDLQEADLSPHDSTAFDGTSPVVMECTGMRPGSTRYHVGDGYFYLLQRASGGRMYLRCVGFYSSPRCSVRAVMNNDRSNFNLQEGDRHTHGPDHDFQRVMRLRESLIEACRARPLVRVELIYHDICRSVRREVTSRVSLVSMRPSMIRVQNEHRPVIPRTLRHLAHILASDSSLGRTLDNEMELFQGLVGDDGSLSIVYMSRRVVDGLHNVRDLFGDGTFYARPNTPDSAQLYTLVTSRDNHVIPLCYALMESRSIGAYRSLFNFLRQFAPELDPENIMTDFESAQQIALREIFPRSRLSGCLWHYTRALSRNLRRLGLHALIRDDDNARRIARLCLAIPLAPPNRLQEALNAIVVEARRLQLLDDFNEFFQYIRNTWLVGVGEQVLSVFGVRHRTNNAAETFHRNINARLVQRPNVWRFTEIIREMEDLAWRDLGRIELGQAPSRARRLSSLFNDARIRSCSRQVFNREMDMLHFLSSVSHHLEGVLVEAVQEEDIRPPSPERHGRYSENSASRRSSQLQDTLTRARSLSPGAVRDLLEQEELQVSPIATGSGSQPPQPAVDQSDAFEDLMELAEVPTAPRANRARRGNARAARGRGRMASASRQPSSRNDRTSPYPTRAATARADVLAVGTATTAGSPSPSTGIQLGGNLFHDDFSDAEDVPENISQEELGWTECLLCFAHVGHYAMRGCGAYPLCGTCLRRWFFGGRGNQVCPHCRNPCEGWLRLHML